MKVILKCPRYGRTLLWLVLALALQVIAGPQHAQGQGFIPTPQDFFEGAPQGFGDRQNSGAWSMQWWNGHLYVGTARAWYCWVQAGLHEQVPLVPYPPPGPNYDCAASPALLPLRAEIWRFNPQTGLWERVYQSPQDVLIPGAPGLITARDIGYRGMAVFQEPDGTEALYVGAATSYLLWPPTPPPRILRSVDGVNFVPIPQEPGTVLGDLGHEQTTFRGLTVFNNRLYILNGAIRGEGSVLEATNPAGGNDNFRWITPQDMKVYEMEPYNGHLYLGVATDFEQGYSVVKTDAAGPLPYTFETVVPDGAHVATLPSNSVVSMYVFKDRLYVGTNRPVELIRINPDDSWDLIVGRPRDTPEGPKEPLSGLGTGFDWLFNAHLWRMGAHNGVLYMGTLDQSSQLSEIPSFAQAFSGQFGFDLYATVDGVHLTPITVNGFGDKFQVGLRTLQSTPYGLFLGGVSYWFGMRMWRLPVFTAASLQNPNNLFIPLVRQGPLLAQEPLVGPVPGQGSPAAQTLAAPARLAAETSGEQVVLSWDPPPGATRYRVYRAGTVEIDPAALPPLDNELLGIPDVQADEPILGSFVELGVTADTYFVDETAAGEPLVHYYVVAENEAGAVSQPSNLARSPALASPVTFASLDAQLARWRGSAGQPTVAAISEAAGALASAQQSLQHGDLEQGALILEDLRRRAAWGAIPDLASWRAEDLELYLSRLIRRVHLARLGLLDPASLNESSSR